ncbi:hypothetical protein D2U88_13670 [Flagellimonas aequoris]|uniref:Uncharacterized protein n=1 Tax=Flagellimonas aequoris TaxID=2306997 RepID=A0A418N347_9FLAO|nr:hypothetical protein D2U88_13670 [Allomuricauda aequoris]
MENIKSPIMIPHHVSTTDNNHNVAFQFFIFGTFHLKDFEKRSRMVEKYVLCTFYIVSNILIFPMLLEKKSKYHLKK